MSDPTTADLRKVAEAAAAIPVDERHQSGHWERFAETLQPEVVLSLLDDNARLRGVEAERDEARAERDALAKALEGAEQRFFAILEAIAFDEPENVGDLAREGRGIVLEALSRATGGKS